MSAIGSIADCPLRAILPPWYWPVIAIYPSDGELIEFELDGRALFGDQDAVMASALLSRGFSLAGLVG